MSPLIRPLLFFLLVASAYAQSPYANPLSKVVRNKDGTVLTVKVDTNEQRVEETLKNAAGGVIWKIIRELDEDNQPVIGVKFDGEDQIVSRHKYLCLRGRMEEEEIYDAKNKYLAKMVYHYDNKGRLSQIDHYNPAGTLVSTSKSSGGGVEPIRQEMNGTTQPNTPANTPAKKR